MGLAKAGLLFVVAVQAALAADGKFAYCDRHQAG
jgi:hypothetical protein